MAHARVLLVGALVFGVGSGTASAQFDNFVFPIDAPDTVTIVYGDVNPLSGGSASGGCVFCGNRHWNRFGLFCPIAGGNMPDTIQIYEDPGPGELPDGVEACFNGGYSVVVRGGDGTLLKARNVGYGESAIFSGESQNGPLVWVSIIQGQS